MIRAAVTLGTLALLCGLGWLAWQNWDSLSAAAGTAGSKGTAQVFAPPAAGTAPESAAPPAPPPKAPEPPPKPPAPESAKPARAPAGFRTHRVQEGDSLWELSRHYYGSPGQIQRLADANAIERTGRLRIGQMLIIPDLSIPPSTPPDADHEAPALLLEPPVQTERPSPLPPTLSRTIPTQP